MKKEKKEMIWEISQSGGWIPDFLTGEYKMTGFYEIGKVKSIIKKEINQEGQGTATNLSFIE